jgi:hypothetical protein
LWILPDHAKFLKGHPAAVVLKGGLC